MTIFEVIVNPHSFSQTVENLFYLSFLVRDDRVDIAADYSVVTTNPPTAQQHVDQDCSKLQNILHLDVASWKKMIQCYNIQESIIPHREPLSQALEGSSKWYA